MTPEILHDASRQRFLTIVDGYEGYVQYELAGDVMALTHTIVPAPIGGRGITGDLVRHAFDYARAEGLRVAPLCSYAEYWVSRHPEYDDLVS